MSYTSGPLVSIIIPTFNRRELLPGAVESCLAQTYAAIEIIIVDDGSTDETQQMVAARMCGDWAGKIVYHYKPNGGASSAKNEGMKMARGEYIQFLDSDDMLRPEKIHRQMEAILAVGGNVDGCVCYGRLGSMADGWDAAHRIGECCQNVETFIRRQCERTIHILHTEAPLWRRGFLLEELGWREDLSVAEEWEYYIRLLAKRPRLASVNAELFFVRAHAGEQLSKNFQSLSHSLSFYKAVRAVHDLLQDTPFWVAEVRAGLLLRARTTYINLLRCGDEGTIQDYEDWFMKLAGAVPDRKIRTAVLLRRRMGKSFALKIFDTIRRPQPAANVSHPS